MDLSKSKPSSLGLGYVEGFFGFLSFLVEAVSLTMTDIRIATKDQVFSRATYITPPLRRGRLGNGLGL